MSARGLALAACLGALASGCCNVAIELDDPPKKTGRNKQPEEDDGGDAGGEESGGEVDLGVAAFPRGNDDKIVRHAWWLPELEPQKYRLGYRLAGAAARTIEADYTEFARKVRHRKLDGGRFQWHPPAGCLGGLQCVYQALDEGSAAGVDPITALFRARARGAELSSADVAALVVTFVQEIEYKIPEDEPFGVRPPALVAREKLGDCDSKSLLAHMILRSLGLRSVLISSAAHRHTMLGVALPTAGSRFTWQGTSYAFVELTAPRSPIGFITPKLLRPDDWRVVMMRYGPS
jgi:hypothetical protein